MSQSGSTTPVEVNIRHHQPVFDFKCSGLDDWNDRCAARSHFWNGISALLPNMEVFCVKAVSDEIGKIHEPKLREEIRQFCRQESEHAGHHGSFNQLLYQHYPGLTAIERAERGWLSLLARLPSKQFIAIFVFFEHMTSIIGHRGLEAPDNWFHNADAQLFELWQWHALEEVAHKAVCFDCHRALGGGYISRLFGAVVSFLFMLLPSLTSRIIYLAFKSGQWRRWRYWKALLGLLFGRTGVVRLCFLDVLTFFKPGFEPWQMDSRALLASYAAAPPTLPTAGTSQS